MELHNKVVLITGAARGIGAATADFLAEAGATVIVADINLQGAERFANTLTAKGRTAHAVKVDVTSEDSVLGMMEAANSLYGRLDVLVNNAGIINSKPIHELDIDEWDTVMNINLRGSFLCSKAAITEMVKRRSGKIINMASMAGQIGGLKAGADYTASKAGIIGMTKSFARYGAPFGTNVNAVAPGFIQTEMTKGRDDSSSVPLGRLGTAKDVAKAVYFLASPLSDYITGATIDVNGGLFMR